MSDNEAGSRSRERSADGENPFSDPSLAYFLLRLTLGVNMAMHGLVRILGKPGAFAGYIAKTFEGSAMPPALLSPFSAVLPWVELAIGVLLVLGFATRPALIAGGLLMTVLTFGVTLIQKWDVAGLQLTYAVVFSLLLFLRRHNRLALDALLSRRDTLR